MTQRDPLIHRRERACNCGMGKRSADEHIYGCPQSIAGLAAERLADEINALPPREQAELLDIRRPHDAVDCPICFDEDRTGCLACGGTGRKGC